MTEPDDARCPGCGAAAASRYCPHCGARTGWTDLLPPAGPAAASAPSAAGPLTGVDADAPTLPALPAVARPVPVRAVPEMFSTEFLPVPGPPQAWSQAAEPAAAAPAQQPGLFPGWTGMYPAVPIGGAAGAMAPRPERRRKAIYAVLGIAAATVVVLLAALLIAPRWGGTGGVADKVGPGSVVSNPGTAPTVPSSATTTPTTKAGTAAPTTAGGGAPVQTVTVTASTSPASTAQPSTPKPSTPKPSTPKPSTAKPTAPPPPLGVPQRDIACSAGYIVQLASELDRTRFKARVAALKSAGRLPSGALVADSTRSCRLFTSQVNTLVLYSGPFASKYDGCAARLAGPADAYIKGGNADSASEYISCLCPASTAGLPQYSAVGQQGVWVGELQRVLAGRLNIEIGDLAGNWGRFTTGTQSAVRTFQQMANLPSTGTVDARTWSALQSAEC